MFINKVKYLFVYIIILECISVFLHVYKLDYKYSIICVAHFRLYIIFCRANNKRTQTNTNL